MYSNQLRALSVAGVVLAALPLAAAGQAVARRDADAMKQKIAAIAKTSETKRTGSRAAQRTTVTEGEVNAYLALDAHSMLPTGVVSPALSILGPGRLSGRAVVDLDKVREEKKPTSLLDPMSYLTGRLPVTATGVLRAENGVGRFELESAQVGGVPIPKRVLQQIISYYSRSPERPSGFSLDDPVALPAQIRAIEVGRGEAVIVQ